MITADVRNAIIVAICEESAGRPAAELAILIAEACNKADLVVAEKAKASGVERDVDAAYSAGKQQVAALRRAAEALCHQTLRHRVTATRTGHDDAYAECLICGHRSSHPTGNYDG